MKIPKHVTFFGCTVQNNMLYIPEAGSTVRKILSGSIDASVNCLQPVCLPSSVLTCINFVHSYFYFYFYFFESC